jgi:hypothetical protein
LIRTTCFCVANFFLASRGFLGTIRAEQQRKRCDDLAGLRVFLHTAKAVRYPLSVGREAKTEIPAKSVYGAALQNRPHAAGILGHGEARGPRCDPRFLRQHAHSQLDLGGREQSPSFSLGQNPAYHLCANVLLPFVFSRTVHKPVRFSQLVCTLRVNQNPRKPYLFRHIPPFPTISRHSHILGTSTAARKFFLI